MQFSPCLGCVTVYLCGTVCYFCGCVFVVIVVLQAGRAPAADVSWAGSGEQSGTLYWVYWGSSGCNLIQYPAITEPHCLLSLPHPPTHIHTPPLPDPLSLSLLHLTLTAFLPLPLSHSQHFLCKSLEKFGSCAQSQMVHIHFSHWTNVIMKTSKKQPSQDFDVWKKSTEI